MNECDIFMAALQIESPEERETYLDETCGKDTPLRQRVDQLLDSHAKSGSLLEHPAAEDAAGRLLEDTEKLAWSGSDDGCSVPPLDEVSLDFLDSSDMPDSLGRLGQYEIQEIVGRGGMGIVLKGNDPKLNRIVAVKVLAPELASNASARKRFLREGRAAAAVSHDHVVTIYGIDDGGTLPFIAMEYISGPSLEERIKGGGSLEPTEILRIGMQIASGLSAAHEQGLAHRDVKPANILLENGVEKVKITDFGLARAVDDVRMTKPGVVTGTPEYMSPEQARGEAVDHRTDLFSLGSVMYAMCTGRSPFRAENTVAMIRRVCEDTQRPIQDVNSDIPGWLVHIIDELLAKSSADRFQSASELAELLGHCLAHLQQPSVNPLPERLESARIARRRTRTTRRGWLAAATAILVALGGLSLTEATGVTDVTGTVIRIVRGDGTLVVEVDDPGVNVSIDGEQLVITGAGPNEIRLGVGQYELKAVKDGEPVHTELVSITRDGKQIVRVNAQPLPPAEVDEAPQTEPEALIELQETWPYQGLEELDVLSISPGARYCAFAGPTGLAVRNLRTGEDQTLSERVLEECEAYISYDRKWVAYSGREPDKKGYLRIVGIDGSGERLLHPYGEKAGIRLGGWSPDGQHVLAAIFEAAGDNNGPAAVPVRIATISVADGLIRLLKSLTADETDIPRPLFSPDGRYVVYSRMVDTTSKQKDVFLIPMAGGPETPLVESPADDDVFGWLPAGQNFLYRNERDPAYRGDDEIWMIHVVDGKPQGTPRLVRTGLPCAEAKHCLGPVQTPTGGWAFYYSDYSKARKGSHPDVYIADFDLEEGRLVGEPRPASERFRGDTCRTPGWSPDGQYLAYHTGSRISRFPRNPAFLVIRSMQTGHERAMELGENVIPARELVWSPDGRSILLSAEFGRLGPLLRLEVESGAITTIGPPSDDVTPGSEQVPIGWSPDGKAVYARRNPYEQGKGYRNVQILMHNLDTGQETELYREEDGGIFDCHLSPDGSQIAYAAPVSMERSVMLMPTAGGEPRELFSVPAEEKIWYTVGWSPDGSHLLFWKVTGGDAAGQSPPTYELWRISADGGQPEKLAWKSQTRIFCMRLHPNGNQVAFTLGRSVTTNHIRMLQIVGLDELAKETCTANLRTIGSAIEQYKKEHGDVPDEFDDLYPDYLRDPNLLRCPARLSRPFLHKEAKGPKMPCCYTYPFGSGTRVSGRNVPIPADFPDREGMTWTEARKLQMEYYGPVVPIAMCVQYHDGPLCLSYDGEIYDGEEDYWSWLKSPTAKAGLLSRLRSAMQSEPATWAERYDLERFQCLLEDDVALTKFLKTHLKEHPEDRAARKFLADVPRLRFSLDDVEEDVEDGSVPRRSHDLDLIHDTDPDNNTDQIVGIRFHDIPVPQGARIKRVYLQFTSHREDPGSEKTDLVLHAELADDAEPLANVEHNVSSRRKTAASVAWSPEPWTTGGERSEKQRTPDLSSLIQEVVDQPDWRKGNALVLIIGGSGRRNAECWGGGWTGLPMLYVEH